MFSTGGRLNYQNINNRHGTDPRLRSLPAAHARRQSSRPGALGRRDGWRPEREAGSSAIHCTVHRGQPPLRRHRSVSTLVEASGLCWRGCRLITSRSVCLRRGGHPSEARRFKSVGWHSCPGRLSLPRWSFPLSAVAASALPEESTSASCEGKILFRFFIMVLLIL